jgi:diaminohydroxyphosphoribosylaminopyrimidine deaminase/5-amino-6-(5-phosphoribosylamino)uracil reductase
MRFALRLAEKGRRDASPNPLVGACVVRKGRLAGSGYHEYAGGAHAEAAALQRAGKRARGGVLYVTLEPCSTWGRTPPCVAAVLRSGVRTVVIGSLDPNPMNHAAGARALRRAGIRVVTGILAKDVALQNEGFFKRMRTGYPFVALKMAQTLDGKIASRAGTSRWISSRPARQFVSSCTACANSRTHCSWASARFLRTIRGLRSAWERPRAGADVPGGSHSIRRLSCAPAPAFFRADN